MNSTILDALDYFHSIKKIDPNTEIKFTDELHNLLPIVYIKEDDKFIKKVYNVIGYYSFDLEAFIWAWTANNHKYYHTKINQLILHGINIEPITMSDFYIKKILTTSIIETKDQKFIEIITALSCYLTKAHGFIFETFQTNNYYTFYVLYDIKDVEGLEIKPDL
jgi:hypothetical protein